jgi:hypothetical protein
MKALASSDRPWNSFLERSSSSKQMLQGVVHRYHSRRVDRGQGGGNKAGQQHMEVRESTGSAKGRDMPSATTTGAVTPSID